MGAILRGPASGETTKNLIVAGSAEILRGDYPAPAEGLRMTGRSFRMDTNYHHLRGVGKTNLKMSAASTAMTPISPNHRISPGLM
jgi:hypothetical protein